MVDYGGGSGVSRLRRKDGVGETLVWVSAKVSDPSLALLFFLAIVKVEEAQASRETRAGPCLLQAVSARVHFMAAAPAAITSIETSYSTTLVIYQK